MTFVKGTKSIEEIVVVPAKTTNRNSGDEPTESNTTSIDKPLRRARSDGDLVRRASSLSDFSMRTNWERLAEHLRKRRYKTKLEYEQSVVDAFLSYKKKEKRKRRRGGVRSFGRKLSCLFFGPMFYRHRYRVIIFLEVFVPICIFVFVSWAFTAGISWKKAYSERKAADSIAQKYAADFNAIPTEESVVIQKFRDNFADALGRVYIAFSPNNDFTVMLMRDVITNLGLNSDIVGVFQENQHSATGASAVSNPSEVLEHCLLHRLDKKAHKNPVGIDFTVDDFDNITTLPHTFKFVIRTFDKLISETLESHPYVAPPRKVAAWYPPYVESGFIGLQYAIQKAFMKKVYNTMDAQFQLELEALQDPWDKIKRAQQGPRDPTSGGFPTILFKLILTPNYFDKTVRQLISVTICLILCLSYTGLSFFIVRQIVIENQSGIKDFLSLHNMAKYLHWVIYFFHSLVFRTITAAGITLTLYIDYGQGPIFTHSTWAIVYMLIFFHLMSLSSFNFLIGTFLSSVTFSGILSMSVCFFSFVLPYCLVKTALMSETANLVFALIFPNWALWNAIVDIVDYECDSIGVNWSNIYILTNEKSLLTYVQCMLIFIGGNIIYFLIAMARDLIPSKNSNMQFTWFRCLQKVFKHRPRPDKNFKNQPSETVNSKEDDFPKPLIYERPEVSNESLAKIRNLSKSYSNNNLVLDNVSLDFVSGEITVILGHADSGKSTLIHCLAGLVEPTTGHVTINGKNLYERKSKVREYIGLCPQEVVLFNVLSVQEHLILCYKLHGLSTKDARTYSDGLMELLRLTDMKKKTPSALTNDEKRKLSIALCLVDKPSVIVLDEPTNGLEPLTRHEIWNILKSLKAEGHTIVMSTSMMDEAEFLGDRVALLSHGKLVCYGTPKFLKERYDTGYYLRITPNPSKFNLETFQILPKKYFNHHLREAPEKTMFDLRNFLLVLPRNQVSKYPDFFDALENSKENLGIVTYGAQTMSLSEIFVKISEAVSIGTNVPDVYIRGQKSSLWGKSCDVYTFIDLSYSDVKSSSTKNDHSKKAQSKNDHSKNDQTKNDRKEKMTTTGVPTPAPTQSLCPTKKEQFMTMIKKLWLYGIGGHFFLFWEIVIPLVLIWLTVWHSHCFVLPPPTPVEREFSLSSFSKAKVYFRVQGIFNDRFGWRSLITNYLGEYGEELKVNEDIEELIAKDMDMKGKNIDEFTTEKRMIALDLRSNTNFDQEFWAYYSSGSLHSPALVLTILGNLFLQAVANTIEPSIKPFTISVANTPFPFAFESNFSISCGATCMIFGLVISFCLGFFSTLLMTFPTHERTTGMKQLQFMTGLHPFTYWLAYYVFHFVLCAILCGLVICVFYMDSTEIYSHPQVIGTLLLIIALFLCWSGIPWVYYLTVVVPTSLDLPIFGFIVHLLLAFIPMLILELGFEDTSDGFVVFLRYFFHLFPPFTLTSAIHIFFDIVSKRSICLSLPKVINHMCSIDKEHSEVHFNLNMKQIFNYMAKNDVNLAKCCERICKPTDSCSSAESFFSNVKERMDQPQLFTCVIAFLCQGILYWILLMLFESRYISDFWHNLILKFLRNKVFVDKRYPPDIAEEKKAVDEAIRNEKCPEGTLMVCQDLTKSYTEHMIISDVNIELKEGEVVALLGGSECGKSQVIKMIAGSVVPTHGNLLIDSINLHTNRKEFLRRIGYCPQGDAFFDNFTGLQMMELMGRLRGLPTSDLPTQSKKWLHVLGLADGANDRCSTYSKSMRRRLSGAMALIGRNSILLLDEPTRGLDSIATQRFWSVIQHLVSQGHSVIFTSSNVAECEKNCTKVLVLSEGNVQCIGPPNKLRERFSRGFTYLIRLRYDALTPMEIVSSTVGRIYDLKKTIEKKYKQSILRDEEGNLLLYFLSGSKLTWGEAFRIAEQIQLEHAAVVENYSISQATLDDVFVLLTNKYQDMDMPRSMRSSFVGEISQYEAEIQALEKAKKAKNI